ncbi:MAG TPA: ATP-binding protein [Caulobacteraceae bacterium]|jgi:signal transduction histidine kinase|nr:ATP-binding protein [Caulobacteraceae bacterium]
MFRRLSTKLAVLYAGLFGAILLVVSLAVYSAIAHNAERMVRDELQASGTVFDRTWALRSQELQDSAGLLSRDFGFRAAVATGDAATARSALQNLRARLGIDLAFIVGVDGNVTTADGRSIGGVGGQIYRALDEGEDASGVFVLDDQPYQAVSAPILSPTLAGWVVFAQRLDAQEMKSLEQLSAIPLDAMVLSRRPAGDWVAATGHVDPKEGGLVSRFIASGLTLKTRAPRDISIPSGAAIALVKPLHSLGESPPTVLMLRYPLAKAMAPFRPLVQTLLITGALGVVLVVIGSFLLAGSVTRPITALEEAARRLKVGEDATVTVKSRDEIAALADSFNSMAAEIRDREAKMLRDAETLAVALDRAETANRTTNEFLANMSHELRTPLNGVIGLAQVLAGLVKEPTQARLIGTVTDSARQLEILLSDILDAAKLSAGQTEVVAQPFSIGAAVRAAGAAFEGPAAKKRLSLAVDIPDGPDPVVMGDPQRLRQILDNLLSNAVKFTASGGVRLALSQTDAGGQPRFRITVADTGVGFDPAMTERLFERFKQADGSATRQYGGTGLGLSISRGLAELMGGTLDGAPRPEGGSIFTLELQLPLAAQAAAEAAAIRGVA